MTSYTMSTVGQKACADFVVSRNVDLDRRSRIDGVWMRRKRLDAQASGKGAFVFSANYRAFFAIAATIASKSTRNLIGHFSSQIFVGFIYLQPVTPKRFSRDEMRYYVLCQEQQPLNYIFHFWQYFWGRLAGPIPRRAAI